MKFFLLFLALIAYTFGLSCYERKAFGDTRTTIVKDVKYCYARFAADGHMYSFSGSNYDPKGFYGLSWQNGADELCDLKPYETNDGKPYHIFVCVCGTSLCNTPMPFDEFQRNGYRLSSVYH